MEPGQAEATLQEIESVRRRTRGGLRSFWSPLVVFGPLMSASGSGAVLGAAFLATGLVVRPRKVAAP